MARIVNIQKYCQIVQLEHFRRLSNYKQRDLSAREKDMEEITSVHSANIAEVHDVPMKVIIRPLIPVLDEGKVNSLMLTIQDPQRVENVPPIDILWVKGRKGGDYYYSFGGCHRYEAYRRLQRPTIPCKIVKSTIEDIQLYLGSSMPDLQ